MQVNQIKLSFDWPNVGMVLQTATYICTDKGNDNVISPSVLLCTVNYQFVADHYTIPSGSPVGLLYHNQYNETFISLKLTRRKQPDHLADSCKRSIVNWTAAGSRPPSGFFLPSPPFQTHFLQTFSTCAVKP